MKRNKNFSDDLMEIIPSGESMSVMEWLAEQMPGGFFIYRADDEGELLYVNGPTCEIFGCETVEEFRELTGNTFRGMVYPDDYEGIQKSIDEQISQTENSHNMDYVAYRIRRKDGAIRWVDDYGHIATLPGYGEVFYVFITDITETKLAEEEKERAASLERALRQAEEANEAKIAFLSNMSHEIRTPITAILGMNEMIQREAEKEEILEYSENIRKAGVSLLGIISDILDFSKIETGRMELEHEEYSLKSVIGDLYNLVMFRTEAKGLGLEFLIDPKVPDLLMGDEIRIKQVITNLLTNAVKYTEKGVVIFELKMAERLSDSVRLEVSVTDTGIGIRKEDMERLFEPFDRLDLKKTRSIEGSGLGLAITRRILLLMDSELHVESTYEKGSKFYFTIEQKVAGDEPVGEIDVESLVHGGPGKPRKQALFTAPGLRLLLVDDTPMNLQVIAGLLKRTKMRIDQAGSGAECIEKLGTTHYDMVFLDYRMPQMNGIETLAKIREMYPDIFDSVPIISLTASAVSGDKEKMISAGFTDYLSKPVNADEMERMMIRYLPEESVVILSDDTSDDDDMLEGLPEIIYDYPQLNAVKGVEYCGDVEDYIFALETYEKSIEEKAGQIEADLRNQDIESFTMDVHSLKSTSGAIGATHLFEKARDLEMAGKEKDIDRLQSDTPELLDEYRGMHGILEQILDSYHAAEEAEEDVVRTPLGGRRILIAEDMDIDAQIIRQVVHLRNMEADIASDGEEAVKLFEESEPGLYDAVLLDIGMPKMNGLEATKRIRALDREDAKEIPIIALTGSSSEDDVKMSLSAGMNAHLSKPVEPDALFDTLGKLIKEA